MEHDEAHVGLDARLYVGAVAERNEHVGGHRSSLCTPAGSADSRSSVRKGRRPSLKSVRMSREETLIAQERLTEDVNADRSYRVLAARAPNDESRTINTHHTDSASRQTPVSANEARGASARPCASHDHARFGVPFHSAMSDADIAHLAAELNMTTCFHPKLQPAVAPLGFVRLDFYSGLFLLRGKRDSEWGLECRTWGRPAPDIVHEWMILAAGAARLLDPGVPIPSRAEGPRRPEIAPPRAHPLRPRRRPR